MYCHSLIVSKDEKEFEIPCEDMATFDGVDIWPYDLGIKEPDYSDIIEALLLWARSQEFKFRLYITNEHFE